LANEMTGDRTVQATSAVPDTRSPGSQTYAPEGARTHRVEGRVARTLTLVVLACIGLGLIISAILFRQMLLAAIGALVIIPFMLLVSAPVWLAGVTKEAQDETVREQHDAG
jgi:hypothetical protein